MSLTFRSKANGYQAHIHPKLTHRALYTSTAIYETVKQFHLSYRICCRSIVECRRITGTTCFHAWYKKQKQSWDEQPYKPGTLSSALQLLSQHTQLVILVPLPSALTQQQDCHLQCQLSQSPQHLEVEHIDRNAPSKANPI